jgi:Nuclear pore assembly and biogenesis
MQAHSLYNTLDPYLTPLRRTLYSTMSNLNTHVSPIIRPLFERSLIFAQESPALISALLLVSFLILALKIMDVARRMLMWWTRLVMKLMFWGIIGLVGIMVWQRGFERSVGDLMAWGQELSEVWSREYRRWDGYSKHAGSVEQMRGGGRARW